MQRTADDVGWASGGGRCAGPCLVPVGSISSSSHPPSPSKRVSHASWLSLSLSLFLRTPPRFPTAPCVFRACWHARAGRTDVRGRTGAQRSATGRSVEPHISQSRTLSSAAENTNVQACDKAHPHHVQRKILHEKHEQESQQHEDASDGVLLHKREKGVITFNNPNKKLRISGALTADGTERLGSLPSGWPCH